MSSEGDIRDGGGEDNVLAAEYVLGTLSAQEHADYAARMVHDAILRSEVAFWQHRLSQLDSAFEEVPAPAASLNKIEKRLFGAEKTDTGFVGFWNNLALWRGLTAGGLAVAALAIGISVMQPAPTTPQGVATQMVATLQAEDSDVKFVALYDGNSGAVRLTGLSGDVSADRDFELWIIEGDQKPISMGVIPANTRSEVAVPSDLQALFNKGAVLAITLEPKGGSPTGDPTGPVVAAGETIAI